MTRSKGNKAGTVARTRNKGNKRGKNSVKGNAIKQWLWDNRIYLIPVGIVALIMLCVWIGNKIQPFGEQSLIIVDGLHQYIPFFGDYYDKLVNGKSMLYSWDSAMGYNFLSLWSYYLSSPMNLIILLFPKSYMNFSVSLITTIKVILSAYTFTYYMVHRHKSFGKDMRMIPFAIIYALNNYVIGYYWNVMWMDCIMILPIIVLGFEYLIHKKDSRLYMAGLAYALFCNYYMSFMICIFLVVWYLLNEHKSVKEFFLRGIQFAISSILAAGMSAMVLMPAYAGIMQTASAKRNLPGWKLYGAFVDIFQAHLPFVKAINNQVFDGGVNIYCGVATIFFVVLYVLDRHMPWRTKLKYVLVLFLMIISFNTEILNYIWHGFHNQYGIPNRFAFIYIFVLLVMAYDAVLRIRQMDKSVIIATYLALTAGIWYAYAKAGTKLSFGSYLGGFLILSVFFILVMLHRYKKIKNHLFRLAIVVLACAEFIGNAGYVLVNNHTVTITSYFSDTESVKAVKEYLANDDDFYRVDLAKSKMLDEATWHNLPCVGVFGSTALGHMVTAMGRMGFYTGANEYLYRGATPLTNSILDVKYVLYRENDYNSNLMSYETNVAGIDIYRNPKELSIGFGLSSQIKDWNMKAGNAFLVQNDFVRRTATPYDLFRIIRPELNVYGSNADVTVEDNVLNYTRTQTKDVVLYADFSVNEDMDLYVIPSGSNIQKIELCIDGNSIVTERYQGTVLHVGQVTAGQDISISYIMNDSGADSGTVRLAAGNYQQDVFDVAYETYASQLLQVTEHGDTYIRGTIQMKEDGVFFTSIPYEEGWSIYIDGQKVETYKVGEAFLGADITQGTHSVELKYFPAGLTKGIMAAVVSWILYIGIWIITRKGRKDKVTYE